MARRAYRLLAGHLTSGSPDYAMVGFVLRNTLSEFGSVARGVCQLSDGDYLEEHRRDSPRSSATETARATPTLPEKSTQTHGRRAGFR